MTYTTEQVQALIDACNMARKMLQAGKYDNAPDGKPSSAMPRYWVATADAEETAKALFKAVKPFNKAEKEA